MSRSVIARLSVSAATPSTALLFCFFLFWAPGAAQASTIATADCPPFSSQTNSSPDAVSASCAGGTPGNQYGSLATSYANAQVTYGAIIVTANTMWPLEGCDPGTYSLGSGACEPSSSATGEFTQTDTFMGQGEGTLVVYYDMPAPGTVYGSASLDIDGFAASAYGGPSVISVPITFGVPVTIDATAEISASDQQSYGYFYLTDMQVFSISGTMVDDFPTVVQADSAEYVLSPEPEFLGFAVGMFGCLLMGITQANKAIDSSKSS
jgi:hypothetical protein